MKLVRNNQNVLKNRIDIVYVEVLIINKINIYYS